MGVRIGTFYSKRMMRLFVRIVLRNSEHIVLWPWAVDGLQF
jgi:hypothetical protein